ncbi:MAG: hypothetical protein MTP17_01590 [Candidatus Midichloria sp.]|nr:MAG: hypothetical protein MTP17_01590 [Candidatus Midichloria sp.]
MSLRFLNNVNLGLVLRTDKKSIGKVNIIGKNIKWNGSDLDEIIKAPDLTLSASNKISRINYHSNYGSSFFSNMKGSIDIKGSLLNFNNVKLSNNRISGAMAAMYDASSQPLILFAKHSFIPIGVNSPVTFNVKSIGQMPKLNTEFDITQLIHFISSTQPASGPFSAPADKANSELLSCF